MWSELDPAAVPALDRGGAIQAAAMLAAPWHGHPGERAENERHRSIPPIRQGVAWENCNEYM